MGEIEHHIQLHKAAKNNNKKNNSINKQIQLIDNKKNMKKIMKK